jgi:hypothetical protein
MTSNRKLAALGVLSLIMTVMAVLVFTAEPPGSGGAAIGPDRLQAAEDIAAPGEEAATADGAGEEGGQEIRHVKRYILKDVSGYIGIFEPDDMENPKMVTGINTGKLRAADAKMLADGIVAYGEEELARLLEDFGS